MKRVHSEVKIGTPAIRAEAASVGRILRQARTELDAEKVSNAAIVFFLDSIGKYQLRRLHGDCDVCGKQDCGSRYGGHGH